jgi:hypothetical protein
MCDLLSSMHCLNASGCSTLGRLNPFDRNEGPQETAGEGERISIVPGLRFDFSRRTEDATFDPRLTAKAAIWGAPLKNPEREPQTLLRGAAPSAGPCATPRLPRRIRAGGAPDG